jgi:hypothetical protein
MCAFGHFAAAPRIARHAADIGLFQRRACLRPRTTRALVFLLALAALLPLLAADASAQVHNADAVKAAFVYNLTKYVEWRHARAELIIAFVGGGPMGERLNSALSGKISESKSIRVVLDPSEEALGNCDILFLGAMPAKSRRALLQRMRNQSALTVSDVESFTNEGGMVGLVTAGDHVQIEINLEAVQAARLTISSRLLNLAVLVHPATAARDR